MIRGTVFPNREALVAVELLSADGQFQPFEFILDTGFTGDLSLPSGTIRTLLTGRRAQSQVELADGSKTTVYTWRATALWDANPRSVIIVESDGDPLLGMGLLWQNRITLEARPYGSVVIARL